MRKIVIVSSIVAVFFGVGLWVWLAHARERTLLLDHLPPRPVITQFPEELTQRIARCEDQIKDGSGGLEVYAELARLYHANGFTDEACLCYQGLLLADPKNPRWAHCLAIIISGVGRLDEAIELWRFVTATDSQYVPAQVRLGDALLKANRMDEAVTVYHAVCQLNRNNPYALVGLARVDMENAQWVRARERLELAVQESHAAIGEDLLVTVYEKLGMQQNAKAILGRKKVSGTFFDPPDPWVDEIFFDCYDVYRLAVTAGTAERSGDRNRAIQLLERALNLSPKYIPALYQLGLIYIQMQDLARAKSYFERCVASDPAYPEGWAYLVFILTKQGDKLGSDICLNQALINCPDSPYLHLEKGRRYADSAQYEKALKELKTSINLRPEEADAYVETAQIYVRLGQENEAVEILQQALQAEPGHPMALTFLSMAFISRGERQRADQYMALIAEQPRISPGEYQQLLMAYEERFGEPFRGASRIRVESR